MEVITLIKHLLCINNYLENQIKIKTTIQKINQIKNKTTIQKINQIKNKTTIQKINQCSNDEYEEFKKLNSEYKKKFNFPFIIAVKGKDKNEILNNFRQRIQSNVENEFLEAKKQVKKIATFRLNEINKEWKNL